MLSSLAIRNVVLIDSLNLVFHKGLTVFTGETGAGKSILLDSLSLALGARADSSLVRHGTDKLSVTAEFEAEKKHPCFAMLEEQGIETEEGSIIIRRTVSREGKSKAYVNDTPVSVGLLKQLGESLVEIHGQFERHSLINPATHCGVLDRYGELSSAIEECKSAYKKWKKASQQRKEAEQNLLKAREEEDFLRHSVEELEKLGPEEGENEELASKRNILMHGEKLAEGVNLAYNSIAGDIDISSQIREAQRYLGRISQMAEGKLENIMETLDRATVEIDEAANMLEQFSSEIDINPNSLEEIEERLFSIRSLSRKHHVEADLLPEKLAEMKSRLNLLDNTEDELLFLAKEEASARMEYIKAAENLSKARKETGLKIDEAICSELPPLKLENAVFKTEISRKEESEWNEKGLDNVLFTVATNKGTPLAPLNKIASGGELSRFMLALKVIISKTSPVPCLVFDEVDSDIGGATAAAVGTKLSSLAENLQILVITHSPQVAAIGDDHLKVIKKDDENTTKTSVTKLEEQEREGEIARMLSGANITDEAKAAARSLLNNQK